MDCNKDEAIRAKIIAEKKFAENDFAAAKKFSLKSQNLYPGLDGISQMLVTLDVYISSENKIHGESDWYGVLGVKPSDDDETIRKQYRKMVLMLHPDKNKSVGADGAFKIVSDAWSLLSDKSKRSAYNQRRKIPPKVSLQSVFSSSVPTIPARARARAQAPRPARAPAPSRVPPSVVPAHAGMRAQPQSQAPHTARARAPMVQGRGTFWTVCHGCKMHYEYYKVYMNQPLICRTCHKAFRAVETASPVNLPKPDSLHKKPNMGLFRPEVHFGTNPSGASDFGDNVKMKRKCEEFDAQRLAKKRMD